MKKESIHKIWNKLKNSLSHISIQIILIVGITIIVVLSFIVMLFYNSTIKTIKTNTICSNEIILAQINNEFEKYLKELQNFSLNIRMDSRVFSIIESEKLDYIDQETIGNYLKAMFYSRHDLCDITVHLLQSDTKITFPRDTKKIIVQYEPGVDEEDWFQTASGNKDYFHVAPLETVAVPLNDSALSTPLLHTYQIIINVYTKKPLAALELTCDMKILDNAFKNLKQDETSLLCLSDSSGATYFASNQTLLESPHALNELDYPNIQQTVVLDGKDYLVVQELSKNQKWLLTKFICVDTLNAQNTYSKRLSLITLAAATIISICTISFLVHILTRSFQRLAKQMSHAGNGDFKTQLAETGCYESKMLAHGYNSMIHKIDELIQKNYIMALNEKTAKLHALEAQINPHFLYNSLQVISSRTIVTGDRKLYNLIEALAANLRYSFKESFLVAVNLEIQYIRSYLLLLKARFDDRLVPDIFVDAKADAILIPKLSIFTLIENSIIHGLESSMKQLHITLSVRKEGNLLTISVTDDGPGIPPDIVEKISSALEQESAVVSNGEHIGLRNLNARLKLCYGDNVRLHLTSVPDIQTTTTITISL